MQLPAGVPLGAFLSFRELRSVHTSCLVADTTFPQLIRGIPGGRLALRGARGRLPLHWAVMKQASAEVVTALLDAHPEGAKVKDHPEGRLPLHWAAEKKASAAVVTALLDAHRDGAKVRDRLDRLPLHLAFRTNAEAAVYHRCTGRSRTRRRQRWWRRCSTRIRMVRR